MIVVVSEAPVDEGSRKRDAWVVGAVVAVANSALLVLFRLGAIAAGPFGAAAVPTLLLHFLVCGGLCAIAAASVLRRLPVVVVVPVATVAAVAGVTGSFRAWGSSPTPGPFLAAVVAWAAVPAMVWAVSSTPRRRPAATLTAIGMSALWLVAAISGQ